MKISAQWLRELLPDLKATPQEIADKLTNSGLEVEGIEELGKGLSAILVGHVLKRSKHPNADRLSICEVSNGIETLQIVCGAPNVAEGGKYPLAPIGAILPNGLEIKAAKIRGTDSSGMLCSAKELGLSEAASGLLELATDAPVGALFQDYAGLNDTILEVNVTPNRGDCLSHWGVAREVAALFGLNLKKQKADYKKGSYPIKDYVKVEVKDVEGCRRYMSRVIRNVTIAPSPQWMQSRLDRLGIRPINNVVDATNYVLLETGHPLHAFDHRFIEGQSIVVRPASSDKAFTTLDQVSRSLEPTDLVIADSKGPVALAGVMGGQNSEIRPDTKTLVLEAATFDPICIRKTARRLGLHTESSQRFERFVPADTVEVAMDRLIQLILGAAGGEVSQDGIDCNAATEKPLTIILRAKRIEQILGIQIQPAQVESIFMSLGFKVKAVSTGWEVDVPPYRSDLTREIDLIEELIRIHGINQLQSSLPHLQLREVFESAESRHEDAFRLFWVGQGFTETMHLSFCEKGEGAKISLPQDSGLAIQNPLSEELAVLRPSLLPALLRSYKKNFEIEKEGVRLFELRSVFQSDGVESKRLSGIYGGAYFAPNWQGLKRDMNLFDGKAYLESFFKLGHLPAVTVSPSPENPSLHPGEAVRLECRGGVLGYLGRLHPTVQERFEIKETLYFFDLDVGLLSTAWETAPMAFKPLSPFPPTTRDLALIANRDLSYQSVLDAIRKERVSWLKDVSLFDVYEGKNLPEGKKSLALSLVYGDPERTLTDDEVNQTHFKLVDALKAKLGVELR